jgi:hypothetical protein
MVCRLLLHMSGDLCAEEGSIKMDRAKDTGIAVSTVSRELGST